MKDNNKYPCVCCSFLTRSDSSDWDYDICPVCFWENDPVQNNEPEFSGGANSVSLNQARMNFKKYGAMQQRFVKNVRAPYTSEYPN